MAAKSGTPDVDSNANLRMVVEKAKAANMPKDNIQKAIDKAKGANDNEHYDVVRYEGYGPAGTAFMVDCLTDNSNRTIASMNQCFNKSHCKLGVKGSVSFNYDNLGVLAFNYEDDEKMLDTLIEADVNVEDIELEDGLMTVYVTPSDLHKAQEAIDALIPDCEYTVCAIKMIPQEYVKLEDEHDKELWNRLLTLLDEVDDVQEIFHNVEE